MDLVTIGMAVGGVAALFVALAVGPRFFLGLVRIGENEVGVVVKKFSSKQLPAGALIALNGEAGYQADTLSPGWFFGYFPWQYEVSKYPLTIIPSGEIGLVMANDGAQINANRILAKVIDSDNFQSARKFLTNGGEKGRQLGILTAGTYRINPTLFRVIKAEYANKYELDGNLLKVLSIKADEVGVVTTLDGTPIKTGEIAATQVEGHDNYQNAQAFIQAGGQRGLQEQVLLSGTWNINPWFAKIERMPMTEIPIGHVGVVISYIGKEHKDISGEDFKHGDLVEQGHKGVWATPLYPGKHPLNTRTLKVELVPTTNIALNWATNRSESHKLDEKLSSIKVRSKDGFSFVLDVAQIIHIGAKEASKVISRFGSTANLVNQVLEPAIGNYFRNSAQGHSVLDFLSTRKERQEDALKYIKAALLEYDVEAVDTYIGDLVPPEELMKTQTDRKIAEEQRLTFKTQEESQKQRQSLMKEQSLAEIQAELVKNEQSIKMQDFQAQAAIKKAEGDAKAITLRATAEADAVRLKGDGEAKAIEAKGLAQAKAYEAGVKAMTPEIYGNIQIVNAIGEKNIRITPEFLVTGGGGSDGTNGMMMSAMMASILKTRASEFKDTTAVGATGTVKPTKQIENRP